MVKKYAGIIDLSEGTVFYLTELFNALRQPIRLKILYIVSKQAVTPEQLSEALGVSKSQIAYHMRFLKQWQLVEFEDKRNRERIFRCNNQHVVNMLDSARKIPEGKINVK